VIGLVLVALLGRRGKWGIGSGLVGFFAASAVTVPLVGAYFYYA
jgi:hypothetical protein